MEKIANIFLSIFYFFIKIIIIRDNRLIIYYSANNEIYTKIIKNLNNKNRIINISNKRLKMIYFAKAKYIICEELPSYYIKKRSQEIIKISNSTNYKEIYPLLVEKKNNLFYRISFYTFLCASFLFLVFCYSYVYIRIGNELYYAEKIPILTYHRLVSNNDKEKYYKDNQWVQSVDDFQMQMLYLKKNKYKTISLDEFYCWYINECKLPKKSVVITFDDGFYEDYLYAYPILRKYNMKSTHFVIGNNLTKKVDKEYNSAEERYMTEREINTIKKDFSKMDFQSHSFNFHVRGKENHGKILDSTYEEISKDFDNNMKYNFDYIAYPYGDYNDIVKEIAKNKGLKLGFAFREYTYATRNSDQYEIPRIKINGESNVDTIKYYVDYAEIDSVTDYLIYKLKDYVHRISKRR